MQSDSPKESLLILGGGLMGLAIAHELAKEGRKVQILSRRRNEAAGFVAAGMLAPHAEGLNEELLRLGQLSLTRQSSWIKSIEQNSGLSCGFRSCGIVVPFLTTSMRDNFPTAKFGKKLTRLELETEVPGIGDLWKTGLLFEQDGQIDNRRLLMRALEKACVELGVKFQEGIEVLAIMNDSQKFNGVKIQDAEGNIKEIKAKEGVLCSGAWSNQILNSLPIFPVKGQMLSIQGPKQALKRILFGPGTYLVPREDGLIVIGATSEPNAGFTEGLTPAGQSELQQGIYKLLPAAIQWPPMERWWGFRPCTPDESPLLGESEIQGLWLATGHHRNGVLLAAITSEILTKMICRIPLESEINQIIQSFRWDRFRN